MGCAVCPRFDGTVTFSGSANICRMAPSSQFDTWILQQIMNSGAVVYVSVVVSKCLYKSKSASAVAVSFATLLFKNVCGDQKAHVNIMNVV